MKILLLCNSLIPELAEEEGFVPSKPESWIKGLYEEMILTSGLKVMYLFPSTESISFTRHNFTFISCAPDHDPRQPGQFKDAILSFAPDVIHIFGTEYLHTYNMIIACERLQCLDRVLVSIQGLVSVYRRHFLAFIPLHKILIPSFRDCLRGGGY